jgi:hypothetical protein
MVVARQTGDGNGNTGRTSYRVGVLSRRTVANLMQVITDMALLVCVTGTMLVAATVLAGAAFGWAARWWR